MSTPGVFRTWCVLHTSWGRGPGAEEAGWMDACGDWALYFHLERIREHPHGWAGHRETSMNQTGATPPISCLASTPQFWYNLRGVGWRALHCIVASPEESIHITVCGGTHPAVVQCTTRGPCLWWLRTVRGRERERPLKWIDLDFHLTVETQNFNVIF